MRIAPVRIGVPHLDFGVRHRRAGEVLDLSVQIEDLPLDVLAGVCRMDESLPRASGLPTGYMGPSSSLGVRARNFASSSSFCFWRSADTGSVIASSLPSFPRKRESILFNLDPRLRGGDA